MRRTATLVLLFAAVLAFASASRIPEEFYFGDNILDPTAGGGLWGAAQGASGLLRDLARRRKAEENPEAIMLIKFFVPPSDCQGFEKQWLKMEQEVTKDEKEMTFFDLKKTKLDNLIYLAYGEWETMEGLHEHLTSDHFDDFSKWVDEHGVRWEMQLLKRMATDIEDKEQRRDEKNYLKKRNMHHIIMHFFVRPGTGHEFEDAWIKCAKDAIEEKENRVYNLRKLASDNTRWLAYGTWDSVEGFMRHLESKHFNKFLGFTQEQDIVWVMSPLIKISHESE